MGADCHISYAGLYGSRESKLEYLRTARPFARTLTPEPPLDSDLLANPQARPAPPVCASPSWTPLFAPEHFPNALSVPPDVYRGLCCLIVEIEGMHSLRAIRVPALAVQVAHVLGEDAAAVWVADHEEAYVQGCSRGFRPEKTVVSEGAQNG